MMALALETENVRRTIRANDSIYSVKHLVLRSRPRGESFLAQDFLRGSAGPTIPGAPTAVETDVTGSGGAADLRRRSLSAVATPEPNSKVELYRLTITFVQN